MDIKHSERSSKHALFIPVVHDEYCTGCGKCEEATIKVLPLSLALGAHYRLGWKEKQKAGKSLVAPDIEHKYNYNGERLIETGETPFSSNPLDTLNKSLK